MIEVKIMSRGVGSHIDVAIFMEKGLPEITVEDYLVGAA